MCIVEASENVKNPRNLMSDSKSSQTTCELTQYDPKIKYLQLYGNNPGSMKVKYTTII